MLSGFKTRRQVLADRAAAILFCVAVVSGAITFIYRWFSAATEHALIRTAMALIMARRHARNCAPRVSLQVKESHV
jgi:Cu2+-exporting ATPase